MGDVPQSSSPNDYPAPEALAGSFSGSANTDTQASYSQGRGALNNQSAYAQQLQQQYGNPQHAFSAQFDMAQTQGPARPAPYNMNAMMNALPQANFRQPPFNSGAQRFSPTGPSPNIVGQMQPISQYGSQGAMNPLHNQQQFYMPQQHAHMPQYYGSPVSPPQQQGGVSPRSAMGFYPNAMVMGNHPSHPSTGYYYPQGYPTQGQGIPNQMLAGQYLSSTPPQPDTRTSQQHSGDLQGTMGFSQLPDQRSSSVDSRSNIVRGPPRKPKQSGHAIWIGNLPPQTDLMSLVHHVCKEANGLESLFLISKSNCAFANFKDEPSCVTAQQKLHDSKFQSVRLVSRLRKSTVEGASGVTAPTGPAASTTQQSPPPDAAQDGIGNEVDEATPTGEPANMEPRVGLGGESPPQKDKFFILKSLTVEDLELSVRTGIWATQSHNEETLNAAFKAVDNVYLVFSANKSGEYFGYARMISPINEDPAAAIEFAPKAQTASDLDLPKAIPTEATESAPKGRIIDDSARGTIFWEAEREENAVDGEREPEESGSSGEHDDSSSSAKSGQDGESKAWGKPFKLEWLSTTRLPFYRTRGLRNPWNSNREVKIARDGTELEPSVGRRLIGLFNRVQSPAPGPMGRGMPPMISGYPPMRPPF